MNIPEEAYKRPLGHRFESEIEERISQILLAYEKSLAACDTDTEAERQAKEEKNYRLLEYRTSVNPRSAYNRGRKKPENFKARRLTVEKLDDFLQSVGWTRRFFLEACLEENRDIDPEKCLQRELPPEWVYLDWPTDDMRQMAMALDRLPDAGKDLIRSYIVALLPKSYPLFEEDLESFNTEYGADNEMAPAYLTEAEEDFVPEKKRENMGDRIYSTIKFLFSDESNLPDICKEKGITYRRYRLHHMRHYWAFRPSELKRICDSFKISPHWAFYGDREVALLAESAKTERIMDLFQLLSDDNRAALAAAAQKLTIKF